jgi:hypothetical protein
MILQCIISLDYRIIILVDLIVEHPKKDFISHRFYELVKARLFEVNFTSHSSVGVSE